jgi:hypothetical protein
MRIKITSKSSLNKNAWYNDCIGQEFVILQQAYTGEPIKVDISTLGGNRSGIVCKRNMIVWNGDYEIVKEQDNERN